MKAAGSQTRKAIHPVTVPPMVVAELVPELTESDAAVHRVEQSLSRLKRLLSQWKPPPLDSLESHLTLAQGRCLWNIAHHEGCTLQELSDHLDLRPSTTSELVERLVRVELVQREPDANDRRTVRLSLSERGRAVHLEHTATRRNHLQNFLETLTPVQRTDLLGALEMLDRVLEQVEPRS
jgi:DNA-binding MarR family transcriptional regulator